MTGKKEDRHPVTNSITSLYHFPDLCSLNIQTRQPGKG